MWDKITGMRHAFQTASESQTRITQYNGSSWDVVIVGSGTKAGIDYGGFHSEPSFLVGTITIAATKQFRFEYQVEGTDSNGLGYACNFGVEVYAQVMITKIA